MSTRKRFIVGSRILVLAVVISMVTAPVECLGWRNSRQSKGMAILARHPSSEDRLDTQTR